MRVNVRTTTTDTRVIRYMSTSYRPHIAISCLLPFFEDLRGFAQPFTYLVLHILNIYLLIYLIDYTFF